MTTPLIAGTIVRATYDQVCPQKMARINNLTFTRKLRMIRADVYTLLSKSESSDFFKAPSKQKTIKNSVMKFLEGEFNPRVNKAEVFARLKGWNKLLYQKYYQNQVDQIHTANLPECVKNAQAEPESNDQGCNHYAFATFVEPGYH